MNVVLRMNWNASVAPGGGTLHVDVNGDMEVGSADAHQPQGRGAFTETVDGVYQGACTGG